MATTVHGAGMVQRIRTSLSQRRNAATNWPDCLGYPICGFLDSWLLEAARALDAQMPKIKMSENSDHLQPYLCKIIKIYVSLMISTKGRLIALETHDSHHEY